MRSSSTSAPVSIPATPGCACARSVSRSPAATSSSACPRPAKRRNEVRVTPASSTAPRRLLRELGLQILLLLGTLALAEILLRVIDLRELRDGYSVGAAMVY